MTRQHLVLSSLILVYLTQPALSKGQESTSTTQPLTIQPSREMPRGLRKPKRPDFNRSIYYKNKLEFSLDYGWLPINIPWPFDFFAGSGYNQTPLKYTLEPNIASLRWHMGDVGGPGILRGNWDMTFSGSFTAIPRGPETRYWSYDMGIRRNFVRPNWRVAPYFDLRLGLGDINAKEPKGVQWAQGQDFTFTFNLGSGVRYNFNSRFAISSGINFMHISNLYLSEPKFLNYGINVYGPMVGVDIRLGKPKRESGRKRK
jgi:Lipid A 3-O-deacylase (PagL)